MQQMRHRIRAAAIVVEGDSVLLVQHQHNDINQGESWWVPPGGGIEGEESLIECAQRETLEETGLSVELGRIAYVREFVEPGYHHCEVFFVASSYSGTLMTGSNPGTGIFDVDHIIKDVRFVTRGEMADMTIYPEEIKTTFWHDLANELPETRYLGVQKSESKTYLDSQAESTKLDNIKSFRT